MTGGLWRAMVAVVMLSAPAGAKLPSAGEVLKGEQLKRTRIRWVRQEAGAPTSVEIYAGEAFRINPDWNPQPVKLPYDLKKNSDLEKALRDAHLGSPNNKTAKRGERTLQLLVEGDKTWEVVASWTRPAKSWRKQLGGIYDKLEPLCDVMADVFQPVKKDAAKTGDLKLAPN
jgi:hypothetical protein